MEGQRRKGLTCSAAAGLPTVVFLLVLILLPVAAWGQDNPFFGRSGEGRTEKSEPKEDAGSGSSGSAKTGDDNGSADRTGGNERSGRLISRVRLPRGRLYRALSAVQRNLNESINSFGFRLREGEGFGAAVILLALSFIYGLAHALGPGHRKIILTSYFLQAEVTPLAGIGTALGIAMVHGIAALVLMSVLFFLVHVTVSQTFNAAYLLMERISYGLIVALGGYLVMHAVLESRGRRKEEAKKKRPENAMLIISSGIVPCPGASLLLIFLFAQRLYMVGVLSVFAMSLGMGATLAAVAASVLFAKEKGLKRFINRRGKGVKVLSALEIGGSVLVMLFGAVLLLGVL